jgi:hypothetical protein
MNFKKMIRRIFKLIMLACVFSMFSIFGVGGGGGTPVSRRQEIETRLAEIKNVLAGEGQCDVNALEAEIRTLKDELGEIEQREKRQRIANDLQTGINTGTNVPKPGEQRDVEDP